MFLLLKEISASSIEQNSGANQVNKALQQLTSITQQNSASSEEMASSAEELEAQADNLLETISFFKNMVLKYRWTKKRMMNTKSTNKHTI